MLGSTIICNSYNSMKSRIKLYYQYVKNFPLWYKGRIANCAHYCIDVRYKLTHLKETNFNLGIGHLYKNNLNDAIFRFKLVDKFFAPNDSKSNYYLGLTYFLKNNYQKALDHLQKAGSADEVKLGSFLQNYSSLSEIPDLIWRQYRNFTAGYYDHKFCSNKKLYLPFDFANMILSNITDLPDNYRILELGSNIGLVGYEVKKRFPDSFDFTGVEVSENMYEFTARRGNIYDQLVEMSISDFIRPLRKLAYAQGFIGDTEPRSAAYSNVREDSSLGATYKLPAEVEFPKRSIKQPCNKYDVILSFNALSFTKNLSDYFNAIYAITNKLGYFAFCLPIDKTTHLSLKSKEFIFSVADITEALKATQFCILNCHELSLEKNGKYYMVVCSRTV